MLLRLSKPNFLLEEANPDVPAPGGGAPDDKTQTPPANPPPATPPEEKGDKEYDDFGYEKPKSADKKPDEKPDDKTPPEPKDDKKPNEKVDIKNSATGYGDEVDDKTPPVDDKKPDEKPPGDEAKLDYELDLKDYDADLAKEILQVAKENKLDKAGAEFFAKFRKGQIDNAVKLLGDHKVEQERLRGEEKKAWTNELKEDKDFGGDNFATNVSNVDKLLDNYLPEMKKMLTDRKTMLPPQAMRGLARLAKHVYSVPKFVNGDVPAGDEDDVNNKPDPKNKHLDFYDNKK